MYEVLWGRVDSKILNRFDERKIFEDLEKALEFAEKEEFESSGTILCRVVECEK